MMNEHPSILMELNAALTATPPSISQTPKVSSFTPWPISSMTGLLEMTMSSVACVFICLLIVFSGSHVVDRQRINTSLVSGGGRVRSVSYTTLPHTKDQSKKQGPAYRHKTA